MTGPGLGARPVLPADDIAQWTAALLRDGYCVVRGAIEPDLAAGLDRDLAADFARTPFCEGGFYGARTRRFGRLLTRSSRAAALVAHPLVVGIAERVLSPWCDMIQLNLTQAIALHPRALPQLPHRDQDMWRGQQGEVEYLVNVMWPFTPYRGENGATQIWPHSHGIQALEAAPASAPIAIALDPGDALLFLGSTLHGAGGNRTSQVRRGAIISEVLTPRRRQMRRLFKISEQAGNARPQGLSQGSRRKDRRGIA